MHDAPRAFQIVAHAGTINIYPGMTKLLFFVWSYATYRYYSTL